MSDPENNPQSPSPVADPEMNGDETRRLVNIVFGAMIISSFTLTAFLGLEMKRASKDASVGKAQVAELTRLIQQEDGNIQAAYTKLSEFARKHPDFQTQVLWKYKVATNPPAK